MNADLVLLKEIHACFSTEQAEAWAVAAFPSIVAALPHLASFPVRDNDGFPEVVMILRDTLDLFNVQDPGALAFELYDRLSDVLDFISESP